MPSIDCFTAEVVGSFRRAAGYDPRVSGLTRKFMPLNRWMGRSSITIMWIIEPVVASTLVRGNSTNVEVVKETYGEFSQWYRSPFACDGKTDLWGGKSENGRC